jgi:hypothetical protein
MAEETPATATWEWEGGSPAAQEPTPSEDHAAIRAALAAGQLTVTDPATGYHRSLYAACPMDGQPAAIWRVVRGAQRAITALTMHCPSCGTEFSAPVESLYLR